MDIATQLTQNAKLQASVAIIGAITDLIKQLQKCLQNAAELSNVVDDIAKWNADLQYAIENCISQLSKKVCYCLCFLFFEVWVKNIYAGIP